MIFIPSDATPVHRACPLCGSRRARWLLTLAGPSSPERLLRCADCAMVYLDRPCVAAAERAYYADHIARVRGHRPTRSGFEAEYRRQFPALDQAARLALAHAPAPGNADLPIGSPSRILAPAPVPVPRVLDVGCGNGFLLHRLRELGCRVRGIDLDAGLTAFCRDELGLDVTLDDLDSFNSEETFAAVVMTDALEHLPEPLTALRRVKALLAPHGVALVKVPNWAVGRLHVLLGRDRARFRPNLHIQTEHLNYFTPRTLIDLFRRAGFAHPEILPADATYAEIHPQASPVIIKSIGLLHRIQSALSAVLPGRWTIASCIFGIGINEVKKI